VRVSLVQVNDPPLGTDTFRLKQSQALNGNHHYFESHCEGDFHVEQADLKASIDRVEKICNLGGQSRNVILDISSFPKRWFFPMIRFLVENDNIKNLQVVYTRGNSHATLLAESPETLRVLPTFASMDARTDHDFAFVGVGFHLHSMLTMFGEDRARTMHLLFPFPPGPPSIQRNWKFVQQVERVVQKDETLTDGVEPIKFLHVDAFDVSLAFDAMRIATNNALRTSMMAPYGPKPLSLAMCLFSISADMSNCDDVPAYYSQPQKYAIDYTLDVAMRLGELDAWSYAIKKSGKYLYKL